MSFSISSARLLSRSPLVCHPEARVLCGPKDLSEPGDVPRFLRRNHRTPGSLPHENRSRYLRAKKAD